jgi:hypothetical protein
MIGFPRPRPSEGRFQPLHFLHSGAPGCSREGRNAKRAAKGVTGTLTDAPFATLRPSRRADHSRVKEMHRGTLTVN